MNSLDADSPELAVASTRTCRFWYAARPPVRVSSWPLTVQLTLLRAIALHKPLLTRFVRWLVVVMHAVRRSAGEVAREIYGTRLAIVDAHVGNRPKNLDAGCLGVRWYGTRQQNHERGGRPDKAPNTG